MRKTNTLLSILTLLALLTFGGTATFNFAIRPAEDQIPFLQQFLKRDFRSQ